MTKSFITALLACHALLLWMPARAQDAAQNFPNKLVRITSPFPTALTPDVLLRLVANKLSQYWSQQVIVDPKPGANGFIAIGAVKKAPADGYELLLMANFHLTINPSLFKSIPYDAEGDFLPVSMMFRAPFFIVASAAGPYRSLQDLIAAAKASPGRISYSSPSVGSAPHLGGAMLAYLTGTEMLAVHFKEGAPMFTSIVNGDVSFIVSTQGSAAGLIKAGKLKYLAAIARERLDIEPGVPTVREVGGPADLDLETWAGLFVPRPTPADTVRRLSADIGRALGEPDVRERFRTLGFQATASSPADLAALVRSESRRYADLVKRIGIRAD